MTENGKLVDRMADKRIREIKILAKKKIKEVFGI